MPYEFELEFVPRETQFGNLTVTAGELELWSAVLAQALAAEIAAVIDRFKGSQVAQSMPAVTLKADASSNLANANSQSNTINSNADVDGDGDGMIASFLDMDDDYYSDDDGLGVPTTILAGQRPSSSAQSSLAIAGSGFSVALPAYASVEAREYLSTLLSTCMLCVAFKDDAYCPQLKLSREQTSCNAPPQCHPALNPCPRATDICKPQLPERLRGNSIDYIHHVCVPADKVPGNDAYWAPAPTTKGPDAATETPFYGGSGSQDVYWWPDSSGGGGGAASNGHGGDGSSDPNTLGPTISPNTHFENNMAAGATSSMTGAAKAAVVVMSLGVLVLIVVYVVRKRTRSAEHASYGRNGNGGLRKTKEKNKGKKVKIKFDTHIYQQQKLGTRMYTDGGDYSWDELSSPTPDDNYHNSNYNRLGPSVPSPTPGLVETDAPAPPPVPSSLLKPRTYRAVNRIIDDLPLHLRQHNAIASAAGISLGSSDIESVAGSSAYGANSGRRDMGEPSGFESAKANARAGAIKARQMSSRAIRRGLAGRDGTILGANTSNMFDRIMESGDGDGGGGGGSSSRGRNRPTTPPQRGQATPPHGKSAARKPAVRKESAAGATLMMASASAAKTKRMRPSAKDRVLLNSKQVTVMEKPTLATAKPPAMSALMQANPSYGASDSDIEPLYDVLDQRN